jgi:hypothetical protein
MESLLFVNFIFYKHYRIYEQEKPTPEKSRYQIGAILIRGEGNVLYLKNT